GIVLVLLLAATGQGQAGEDRKGADSRLPASIGVWDTGQSSAEPLAQGTLEARTGWTPITAQEAASFQGDAVMSNGRILAVVRRGSTRRPSKSPVTTSCCTGQGRERRSACAPLKTANRTSGLRSQAKGTGARLPRRTWTSRVKRSGWPSWNRPASGISGNCGPRRRAKSSPWNGGCRSPLSGASISRAVTP